MRLFHALLLAPLSVVVVLSCTANQNDCSKNPLLECFHAAGGSSAAGGAAGAPSGGGGMGAGGMSTGGMAGNGGMAGGVPCARPGVDCPGCKLCDGEPCKSGTDCLSTFCVDGVCCDTACDGGCATCNDPGAPGVCSPLEVGSEDPEPPGGFDCSNKGGCGETAGYCRCDDGVTNGDESDIDCGGPTCSRKCGDGAGCDAKADCVSDHCADSVCCNTDCNGECEACNMPQWPGLCAKVPTGTDDPACQSGDVCSTRGDCRKPAGDSCEGGYQCASDLCPGSNDKCAICQSDADCGSSRVCIDGGCFSKGSKGESCQDDSACDSGYCVDTVCCENACTGTCMGCQINYTGQSNGTCAPILAGYDPHSHCPLADPNEPGPAGSTYCSGAKATGGNSSCVTAP